MIAVQIAMICVFLVFSALFSGSETAIATCNKIRLKKSAEEGDKRSKVAQYLVDHFSYSISTILVGNNLVNIAASSTATVLALALFPDHPAEAQSISAVLLTIALLICGEIMPKIMAAEYSDTLVRIIAVPLRFLMIAFSPIVYAVSFCVDKMSKWWTPKEEAPAVTQNELVTLLETIEDEGVFTEEEGELIRNAIEFTDVTAREILVPRVDVEAFDIEDGAEALKNSKFLLKYSRIPVYRDTFDNVIGILPIKKFMRAYIADPHVDIESLLKPPMFVHMTRPISSILMEFNKSRQHMAIVVDEFGGSMGILTREDILEEIVGDIYDEHDEVERDVIVADESNNTYVIDAGMNIYDFFDLIDFNPNTHGFESEYTTVGGWTTEVLDRFPAEGDTFEYKNMTVEVLKAQAMRVEQLRVTVKPEEEDEEEEKESEKKEEEEE